MPIRAAANGCPAPKELSDTETAGSVVMQMGLTKSIIEFAAAKKKDVSNFYPDPDVEWVRWQFRATGLFLHDFLSRIWYLGLVNF